jgi:hypothetical protein
MKLLLLLLALKTAAGGMRSLILAGVLAGLAGQPAFAQPAPAGWTLKWADEFNVDGTPNESTWAVVDMRDQQADKRMAVVKDGCLQLTVGKVDGRWRSGFVTTAPEIVGKDKVAVGGGHDRRLFAPPPGGHARLELRFRGQNAKGGGAMVAGISTHAWLFSHPTSISGELQPPINSMRGEIDMLEHASPAGGRPWIQSVHITEWPGLKWGEGGTSHRVKSSTFTISATTPGAYWDNTDWHVLVAEWGHDYVAVYFDGDLIQKRTTMAAPRDNTRTDGWDPADPDEAKRNEEKLGRLRAQRRYTGNNVLARYFAFDEHFPLGLTLSAFIFREPGAPGRGIGPLDDEPTDFESLPMTMFYDYVRFYVKPASQSDGR